MCLGFRVLGFEGVVGVLYVHTLVKNLLIKFLMMPFLVAKGCKFDSCAKHNIGDFFSNQLLLLSFPTDYISQYFSLIFK